MENISILIFFIDLLGIFVSFCFIRYLYFVVCLLPFGMCALGDRNKSMTCLKKNIFVCFCDGVGNVHWFSVVPYRDNNQPFHIAGLMTTSQI